MKKNKTIFKNTLWMFYSFIVKSGIQMLYFIIIARTLNVGGYGYFIGIVAFFTMIAPFSSWGSGNILIKNVSIHKDYFSIYWGKALVTTFISGTILLILSALFKPVIFEEKIPLDVFVIIGASELLLSRIIDLSGQAFQALNKLSITANLFIVLSVFRLLASILLYFMFENTSLELWSYFYFVSTFFAAILSLLLVQKKIGKPIYIKRYLFNDLKEGFYFSMSLAAQNIYNDIDKTMLIKLGTPASAGIYGASSRLIETAFSPIRSIFYSTYTKFFEHGKKGVFTSFKFGLRLMWWVILISIFLSIGIYIVSPLIPSILGHEYLGAISAIQLMAIILLLRPFHYIAGDILTGAGFQKTRTISQLICLLVNITLNILLIPKLFWKGAIIASIITNFLLSLILWYAVFYFCRNEKRKKISPKGVL
jgi:O-antigen/teichoic acid export membrane protein